MGLTSTAVGLATGAIWGKWKFEHLEDNLPSEQILRATALAIPKEKRSQFTEKGKFTKEIFDQCCRGTFALGTFRKWPNARGGLVVGGTCWLAGIDKGYYYFVTNKHVLSPDFCKNTSIDKVEIWRPNIDDKRYIPSVMEVAASSVRDLAVLRCEGNFPTLQINDTLNWGDNVHLKKGQQILTIGFPEAFKDIKNPNNFLTSASYVKVDEYLDPKLGVWLASGFIAGGGSGSPAIDVDAVGKPRVIGIVYAGNENVIVGNLFFEKKENVVYGYELDVGSLIKLFQKDQG